MQVNPLIGHVLLHSIGKRVWVCHWLTSEWVHCQLTHIELQSQSNSTDTEIVQDELKHSAPIPSSTHSKGIHKCFHGGCGRKGCLQQVSDGVSDAYALACEHRKKIFRTQIDAKQIVLKLHC